MEFTEADYKMATYHCFSGSRLLRWFCVRSPDNERKLERVAAIVWNTCHRTQVSKNTEGNIDICRYALETHADYKELVSFIPAWLVGIIINIIIKILMDYFINKRAGTA